MARVHPFRRVLPRRSLDLSGLLLAPVGIAAVAMAQALGGVPVGALLQAQATLIVVGGTLGAVLVSYSLRDVLRAGGAAWSSFLVERDDTDALAATLLGLAARAHRQGLVSIDGDTDALADPFLREGIRGAIDEPSPVVVRELLAAESAAQTARDDAPARVFEAAAGYAPTLGILGAVLGLIEVMRNLAAPGALGNGIATAFVATVYGVGLANLVLLPMAGRLRERAARAAARRELMTHGICAIHQRVHPRTLAQTLRAHGVKTGADDRSARLVRPEPRELSA
jgi:chemotaxis protein MotA